MSDTKTVNGQCYFPKWSLLLVCFLPQHVDIHIWRGLLYNQITTNTTPMPVQIMARYCCRCTLQQRVQHRLSQQAKTKVERVDMLLKCALSGVWKTFLTAPIRPRKMQCSYLSTTLFTIYLAKVLCAIRAKKAKDTSKHCKIWNTIHCFEHAQQNLESYSHLCLFWNLPEILVQVQLCKES